MRHDSYLGRYPYFGSSDRVDQQRGSNSAGAFLREENMTEYYRQTFVVRGVSIGVRDVSQVRRFRLQRCFPQTLAPRVECESVTTFLEAGQLHAIVDADGAAAKALVRAISGETPCSSGEIIVGGGLASGRSFRRIVGVVGRSSAATVPNLNVSRNLCFALDMRTLGNRDWKLQMIQSTTAFVGIDPRAKSRDLDPVEQFGLRLAMELVLDPPAIIALCPFEDLDFVSRSRTAALLRRVTTILRKTVIVTSASLGPYLFDIADTTLLFGGAGRVLYSGPTLELVDYFNELRIPRHHLRDDERAAEHDGVGAASPAAASSPASHSRHRQRHEEPLLAGKSEAELNLAVPSSRTIGEDESDGDGAHLFRTPSRISSRLFLEGAGTPSANVMTQTRRLATPRCTVRVWSGEDAVDLAVEWAESDAQTMYYGAKYYDSQTRQRLVEAIDALANEGGVGDQSATAPCVAEPQHPSWRPVVLLSFFVRQAFAETELLMGTIGLLATLLIVSLLMHFQPHDQGGMYNIRGILFLLFSLVLIANEATVGSISSQLRLFFHQRNSGLYGTVCFVFCLTVQVAMVRAVYLILLVPFVLKVVQASKGVVALVGTISVTHALLLYALYALVPSRRFATWAAHAYFGFNLICSGFLLNLRTMPSFFGGASVVRWGYGPALKERLVGREFSCDGTDNTSYCYTGEEYLAIEGFTHDSFQFSVFALCMMGGICLAALALALAVR